MKSSPFNYIIRSAAEAQDIIGTPSIRGKQKVITYIDRHCKGFIAQSPFLVLSTASSTGADTSPRGDHPGFVKVIDEHHLVIPERPGNRRIDSLKNIMENPSIGLLFFIPGLDETLRINGKAVIIKDKDLLSELAVQNREPLLGIGVRVEECFIHCGKALKRSELWNSESWPSKTVLPSAAKIMAAHIKQDEITEEVMEEALNESYLTKLY